MAWEENRCTSLGGCGFEAATRCRIRAAGPGGVQHAERGPHPLTAGGIELVLLGERVVRAVDQPFVLVRSEFGTLSEQDFAEERTFAAHVTGRAEAAGAMPAEQQTVENPVALAGDRVAFDLVPVTG